MIPILYESTETNFNYMGVGALSDCISCTVTEERNGIYECEFKYPISGVHYAEISPDRIVKAKANEYSDPQLFRIYRCTKPINGIVKFYCQHISYDLNTNIVNPFNMAGTAAEMLNRILSGCYYSHRFTATTTLSGSTTQNINVSKPTPARNLLGGAEGSVLDRFGGEYEFDNFRIKLHAQRGQDTGVTIRYGKNMTDINAESSIAQTFTSIYPYAIDRETEETYTLPEKVIETNQSSNYGEARTLAVDFTDKFGEEESITETKLRNLTNQYITRNKIDEISQNIEVSFTQLWQTEEYKDVALLERVGLCDTVTIMYPGLGISAKAKVIKTVYNSLTERYEKIELGQARSNLGSTLIKATSDIKKMDNTIRSSQSAMQKAIVNATSLITGQQGGNVIINTNSSGKPYEILIMDEDNIQGASKVWRWNLGGLGYSSTGYRGQYGTAITMDGAIVADYITTGTLNASIIKAGILQDANEKNFWDLNTGEFRLSPNTRIYQVDGTPGAGSTPLNSYISTTSETNLTQVKVFNKLTNNGALKGIYMQDGELYINATYLKSGSINADLITTGSINADLIETGLLQDSAGKNYWDMRTGEFVVTSDKFKIAATGGNTSLSSYISTTANGSLTQEQVFNKLTNNGALKGIYMSDGKLYINATYIKTGSLSANRVTSGILASTNGEVEFDLDNAFIKLIGWQGTTSLSSGGIGFAKKNEKDFTLTLGIIGAIDNKTVAGLNAEAVFADYVEADSLIIDKIRIGTTTRSVSWMKVNLYGRDCYILAANS